MAPRVSAVCLALLTAAPALAQWPGTAAQSLVVSAASADQDLPRVSPTSDGGMWVSWVDSLATRWDVFVQRLRADGTLMLPQPGLLVADRTLALANAPQNRGLATATNGDALLAFRDTRSGAGLTIAAVRVTEAGAFPWGPLGVQLGACATEPGRRENRRIELAGQLLDA